MSESYDLKIRILAETNQALANIQGFEGQVTGTGGRVSSSTIAMGTTLSRVAGQMGTALLNVAGDSAQTAIDYEQASAKIIAASGLTGEEADALRATIEEASKSLGVTYGTGAIKATQALESLVKAGLDPSTDAVTALESALQLAIAGELSTSDASDVLVAAMTTFGKSADDASEIVDNFVKASNAGISTAGEYASGLSNVGATAANMGLSMDETLAALVQLDNTFGSAQESGTFLNRMLLDLAAKAEDAGISLYNADGSMRSLDDIVGQLRTKIQGFGTDQKAANEYLGQFDTRAQKAITAMVGYDVSVGDTQTELEGMAGAQEYVQGVMDTTAGRMAQYQAQQENMNIGIGATTSQLSEMSAGFLATLGPMGAVASAMGPSALTGVMQTLTTQGIGALTNAISGAGGLTSSLTSAITLLGPAVGIAGVGLLAAGAIVAISDALPMTIEELERMNDQMEWVDQNAAGVADEFDDLEQQTRDLQDPMERLYGDLGDLETQTELLNRDQATLLEMFENSEITGGQYAWAMNQLDSQLGTLDDTTNTVTRDTGYLADAQYDVSEQARLSHGPLSTLEDDIEGLGTDLDSAADEAGRLTSQIKGIPSSKTVTINYNEIRRQYTTTMGGTPTSGFQEAMFNPLVIRHNMQPINAMGDYGHVGEILGGYETLRDYFYQQFGAGLQDLMDRVTVPRAPVVPEQPPVYHLHFPNVRSVERENVQMLADQIGHRVMFLARAKGQYNVRA